MRILTDNTEVFTDTTITSSTLNSTAVTLDRTSGFSIWAQATDSTPSAKTFLDANANTGSDIITVASHGFLTGLKVRLTSSGTLPAGLSLATDYFVIASTSSTIKLASSLVLALAGTGVDITAAASGGTHTITPTTTIAGTVKLQGSLDGSNYVDISSSSQNISGAGTYMWNVADAFYKYVRVQAGITTGQGTLTAKITTKGE